MKNLDACVTEVIEKMSDEEKGLLKCILLYGKKAKHITSDYFESPEVRAAFGKDFETNLAVEYLNDSFLKGVALFDKFKGIDNNYGKQLDIIIKEVLIKALKVPKPIFSNDAETYKGALQREQWVVERLMDSIIINMDEDMKKEFAAQVEELLKEKGINPADAAKTGGTLLISGLTAAKSILGSQFNIIVAQISNLIIKAIAGRGLTVAASAGLQRFVGIFFGPIGWIITALTVLPLITSLLNPRDYSKYIPAVFLIGVARMSQNVEQLSAKT